MVAIHDSVRARDVYIMQTGLDNNSIMEMLIMAYACKTSSAKKIVGVIPYLPYSKQCKRNITQTVLFFIYGVSFGMLHFLFLNHNLFFIFFKQAK